VVLAASTDLIRGRDDKSTPPSEGIQAAGDTSTERPSDTTEPPSTSVAMVIAVPTTSIGQTSDRATKIPAPAPSTRQPPLRKGTPKEGVQRIRLAHTGLCVGEGPEKFAGSGRTVLGQHDCATASPPTELERLPDGTYRIKLHNAEYGLGCATVDYGGTHDGVLLAGADCGTNRADQKFTLEPVSSGYILRSVPGARFCIGVYRASRETGVQLIQDLCSSGSHQVFVLG
jgi:hypothetical protein